MSTPNLTDSTNSPDTIPESNPGNWWRRAVLATIGGIGVGFTVVLAVLAVMAMSPSLKAAGVDAGIAFANLINMSTSTKLSLSAQESTLGIRGYVFVDLDAGRVLKDSPGISASVLACELLPLSKSLQQTAKLTCGEGRDTNRALLAEMLTLSYEQGAKAVVIDVELSPNGHGVTPGEDARLRQVLAANRTVPTLFVMQAEPALTGNDSQLVSSRLRLPHAPYATSTRVAGLPVLMTPGIPARSFPDCYTLVDSATGREERIMNMPRAIVGAVATRTSTEEISTRCVGGESASRIIYSLPSTGVDVDRTTYAAMQASLVEMQVKLGAVYGRCLASNLLDPNSTCSTRDFLKDKIVVLGNSAIYRGDWHYTPLGEMPGSLILINAIRSAAIYGESRETSSLYAIAFKILVMLLCSAVWLLFWAQHYWRRRNGSTNGAMASVRRLTGDAAALWMTIAAVFAVSYGISYSSAGPDHSLDALLPGLTVGLEIFVEIVSHFVKWLKNCVSRTLGWGDLH